MVPMSAEKKTGRGADFYRAQKIHWGKSLFLFAFLVLFYSLSLILISGFFVLLFVLFIPGLAGMRPAGSKRECSAGPVFRHVRLQGDHASPEHFGQPGAGVSG